MLVIRKLRARKRHSSVLRVGIGSGLHLVMIDLLHSHSALQATQRLRHRVRVGRKIHYWLLLPSSPCVLHTTQSLHFASSRGKGGDLQRPHPKPVHLSLTSLHHGKDIVICVQYHGLWQRVCSPVDHWARLPLHRMQVDRPTPITLIAAAASLSFAPAQSTAPQARGNHTSCDHARYRGLQCTHSLTRALGECF
jgi:hypothetical protein